MAEERVSRRGVLGAFVVAGAALLGAVALVPGLGALLDPLLRRRAGSGGFIAVGEASVLRDDRPVSLPVVGEWRDAWSRDPRRELGTVWLQKQGEGDVLAMTAECPHLGCKIGLHPEGESFACPCHESAFALDGSVQDGPSPRAMDRLEARVRDGLVEVRWKRFRTQLEDQVEIG